ncbi:MAG: AAA family ATPase [Bacteroidota bacterium]
MKLVIISGPPAVGKMTIGQELAKLTGMKLFYNHMSLELTHQFFDWGTAHFRRLDDNIRFAIFKEIADSELAGLIFTMVWDYADPDDEAYIDKIIGIFSAREPEVIFIELQADLDTRLERNRTPNRLNHKASKRDLARSEKNLRFAEKKHRMVSQEGDFREKEMWKLDTVDCSPRELAEKIREKYNL